MLSDRMRKHPRWIAGGIKHGWQIDEWATEVVALERALKYCQDDKEVMQNIIDVQQAELSEWHESRGTEWHMVGECPPQEANDE